MAAATLLAALAETLGITNVDTSTMIGAAIVVSTWIASETFLDGKRLKELGANVIGAFLAEMEQQNANPGYPTVDDIYSARLFDDAEEQGLPKT